MFRTAVTRRMPLLSTMPRVIFGSEPSVTRLVEEAPEVIRPLGPRIEVLGSRNSVRGSHSGAARRDVLLIAGRVDCCGAAHEPRLSAAQSPMSVKATMTVVITAGTRPKPHRRSRRTAGARRNVSSSASASGISTSRAKYNAATTIAPPANACSDWDVEAVPCVAARSPRAMRR